MEIEDIQRWDARIERERDELKRLEAKAGALARERASWEERAALAARSFHQCAKAVSLKLAGLESNPAVTARMLTAAGKILSGKKAEVQTLRGQEANVRQDHERKLAEVAKLTARIDLISRCVTEARDNWARAAESHEFEALLEARNGRVTEDEGEELSPLLSAAEADSPPPAQPQGGVGILVSPDGGGQRAPNHQEPERQNCAPVYANAREKDPFKAVREADSLTSRIQNLLSSPAGDSSSVSFDFKLSDSAIVHVQLSRDESRSVAVTLMSNEAGTRSKLLSFQKEVRQALEHAGTKLSSIRIAPLTHGGRHG